jgi:hypothetical protein
MVVCTDNLFLWWGKQSFPFYREWTGPFLRSHDQQLGRRTVSPWPWDLSGAVLGSLDAAWEMTGKWKARRGVKVDQRRFNDEVIRVVAELSISLNEHRISCMLDLVELLQQDDESYRNVIAAIHDAIRDTSAIKPTTVMKPMFGSKVLHHFFPSVIPVFDSAWVLNGVMRSSDYYSFTANDRERWRSFNYERDGIEATLESELDNYYDYLDYCIASISMVDQKELSSLRTMMGDALGPAASSGQRFNRASILWKLDAKITEWCMCGAAYKEGVLTSQE